MIFTEFGIQEGKAVLCLHGMCQDWHSEYELLKPLENAFRSVFPAMDGMYPNSPEFTSFAHQAEQIENYVKAHYSGHIDGLYGASQGGLMVIELLTRGNIDVGVAVTDGVYAAHQGKLAAYGTYWMMKYFKEHGKPPKVMDIMMSLMGLEQDAYSMFDCIYWDVPLESMKRNLIENYTYRTNPKLAETETKVHLWCGSKEPYALKSHRILKKHLKNYDEVIMDGYGHGEFFLKQPEQMYKKLTAVFNG